MFWKSYMTIKQFGKVQIIIRFNDLLLCLQSLSNILKEYELEDYDLSVVFKLKINFFIADFISYIVKKMNGFDYNNSGYLLQE